MASKMIGHPPSQERRNDLRIHEVGGKSRFLCTISLPLLLNQYVHNLCEEAAEGGIYGLYIRFGLLLGRSGKAYKIVPDGRGVSPSFLLFSSPQRYKNHILNFREIKGSLWFVLRIFC